LNPTQIDKGDKMTTQRRQIKGMPFDSQWYANADDCWIWTGVLNAASYALYWDNNANKYVPARRWAYSRAQGRDLVPTERLNNQCGDPQCVNPAHHEIHAFVFKDPNWSNSGPRPQSRGPRPQTWVSGTDPEEHVRYRVWMQQRNQAQWRGEAWALDFEPWKKIWAPHWHLKGRSSHSRCMTRIDPAKPWSEHNVEIITRQQHSAQQGAMRTQGYRSRAQQRKRDELAGEKE